MSWSKNCPVASGSPKAGRRGNSSHCHQPRDLYTEGSLHYVLNQDDILVLFLLLFNFRVRCPCEELAPQTLWSSQHLLQLYHNDFLFDLFLNICYLPENTSLMKVSFSPPAWNTAWRIVGV